MRSGSNSWCRNDDVVTGADIQRVQREFDRVGAVGDADCVGRFAVGGKFAFECSELGSKNKPAAVDDARHRLHQRFALGRNMGWRSFSAIFSSLSQEYLSQSFYCPAGSMGVHQAARQLDSQLAAFAESMPQISAHEDRRLPL